MTSKRLNACTVAVIGAGPYGLSVAAHLKHAGIATRLFGEPMSFWRDHMPKGMLLRSPWRASHLSHPDRAISLEAYASAHGVRTDRPLPRDEFVAYGEWFQKHAVPDIDRRAVRLVEAASNCFRLTLADGEIFAADRVVIAIGLANQDYRPHPFHDLPAALVTHACEHDDLTPFRGKKVAVIGRGQSACESAVLLTEAGAEAEIVSRGEIHWLGAGTERATYTTMVSRLRETLSAPTAVGPFPLDWLAESLRVVRHLPITLRDRFSRRCLQPAAAGWLKPRFHDVQCHPGRVITGAHAHANRIVLDLDTGSKTFDHVLLGTGYQVDLARVAILSRQISANIACADGSPLLRSGFESTVPRLHFVGCYAVKSFGPLMRFIAGAPFAARAITKAARRGTALAGIAELPKAPARQSAAAAPNPSRLQ
jgi:cation diffusion facilitator CzcD-associated flavoprotein CzcO